MVVVVHGLVTQSCLILATVAHQAPLSMGFSRQEYWSGLPFPSPGDLPNPGIKPTSPALQGVSCIAGGFFATEPPRKPLVNGWVGKNHGNRWKQEPVGVSYRTILLVSSSFPI